MQRSLRRRGPSQKMRREAPIFTEREAEQGKRRGLPVADGGGTSRKETDRCVHGGRYFHSFLTTSLFFRSLHGVVRPPKSLSLTPTVSSGIVPCLDYCSSGYFGRLKRTNTLTKHKGSLHAEFSMVQWKKLGTQMTTGSQR